MEQTVTTVRAFDMASSWGLSKCSHPALITSQNVRMDTLRMDRMSDGSV